MLPITAVKHSNVSNISFVFLPQQFPGLFVFLFSLLLRHFKFSPLCRYSQMFSRNGYEDCISQFGESFLLSVSFPANVG